MPPMAEWVTLTEFIGRERSVERPILASGETASGEAVELYAKAMRKNDERSGLGVLAEWCGYQLLSYLKVKVPRYFLAEIDERFIESAEGGLDDVIPGPAFACEAVPNPVAAQWFRGSASSVINREHMAGAVVADIMTQNNDRHAGNALVAPTGERGGQELWLIDNGWPVLAADGPKLGMPASATCLPSSLFLRELVPSEKSFGWYLMMAAALSSADLDGQITEAPHEQWTGHSDFPDRIAAAFLRRAPEVREVVMKELHQFPNAVTR